MGLHNFETDVSREISNHQYSDKYHDDDVSLKTYWFFQIWVICFSIISILKDWMHEIGMIFNL